MKKNVQVAAFMLTTRKAKGFTLAELLMAILVISIIMVALAPVITRRSYDSVSIEVNKKKGEEVWTNPGTYTFDVPVSINTLEISAAGGGGGGGGAIGKEYSKTFVSTSKTTFSVPKGVSRITLTLVAGGGGGGAANGQSTGKVCKSYDWDKWNSGLAISAIPETTIIRGAQSGADLCMFTRSIDGRYPNWGSVQDLTLNDGITCSYGKCCWQTGKPDAIGNAACTYDAAVSLCAYYPNPQSIAMNTSNPERSTYRLPTAWELGVIRDNIATLYTIVNICGTNNTFYCPGQSPTYPTGRVCNGYSGAPGAYGNSVSVVATWGQNYAAHIAETFTCQNSVGTETATSAAYQAKCARELIRVTPYHGSGGASGTVLEDLIIDVLPNDVLEITAGTGGNGATSVGGKGVQGGTTSVIHKRNGSQIGSYQVSGGLGGNGASTSSNASATTDEGTRTLNGSYIVSSGNLIKPDKGKAPSSSGGLGGVPKGLSGAADGGKYLNDTSRSFNTRNTTAERTAANGSAATQYGSGGGGGYTPFWATGASHYGYGGAGKSGYVEIKYTQIATGGGGGAAGAVGCDINGNCNPVKLKVMEGERVTFTIGAGGNGAAQGANGKDGYATTFKTEKSNKTLDFKGGFGGKGGSHNTSGALWGAGGLGGAFTNPSNNTLAPATAESAGGVGGLDIYGFYGGKGATTRLKGENACGGMQQDDLCNLGNATKVDGNAGSDYQPLLNKFGGAGGGGGGSDGIKEGLGAIGSNGYVRIKWDETQNED